jgi:histone acetyltransferase (RNA polymerase elongator complex component)
MDAIKLLKDNNFKIDIHLMPDLPNSSVEKDEKMFEDVLNDENLQADQWKIYPCTVVPWTRIKTWRDNALRNYDTVNNPEGLLSIDNRLYYPYQDIPVDIQIPLGKKFIQSTKLYELLMKVIPNIHPWIRVNRLIRDIPGGYVSNDNYREDARNFLEKEVVRRGSKIQEIRNREVRNNTQNIDKAILVVRKYRASGGDEYFL